MLSPLLRLAGAVGFVTGLVFSAMAPATGEDADALVRARASVVSVLPEWPPGRISAEEPEGTGVVVLDGQHVLTALHVVASALSVRVRTADGEIMTARVMGKDRATDMALMEIDTQLPPVRFADEVELGERVCAIGNAFGLGLSTTCGVVSALNKAGVGFNAVEDFVQTDAAVNPGASGGALVGEDGRLVGMLSAIFTKRSDANIGVNFAVSAVLAHRVASDLLSKGAVRRVSSGFRLGAFPAKGKTGRQSAEVITVRAKAPAAAAGLRAGDRIIAAGKRRIRSPADFVSAMSLMEPGGSIPLTIVRDGAETAVTLEFPRR